MASSLARQPCAWPCVELEALAALEAVMAETRRRCRHRQDQMQAQECPRAAVVAPLVVQEQKQAAAAVAQPLVVQQPLVAVMALHHNTTPIVTTGVTHG